MSKEKSYYTLKYWIVDEGGHPIEFRLPKSKRFSAVKSDSVPKTNVTVAIEDIAYRYRIGTLKESFNLFKEDTEQSLNGLIKGTSLKTKQLKQSFFEFILFDFPSDTQIVQSSEFQLKSNGLSCNFI